MSFVKKTIKIFISMLTLFIVFFWITELDMEIVLKDTYELSTYIIFMSGITAGTFILWTREKIGAALLIFIIILSL